MLAAALKDELSIRASDLETLESQVKTYKDENKGLVKTVKLQQNELAEMHTQIASKKDELSFLEARVEEMVDKFQFSEAEAYFARGLAMEEAAKRTKLAPAKKKKTYMEALELYRKALALGKKEAAIKVTEMETKTK
jgi:hypothetical protein